MDTLSSKDALRVRSHLEPTVHSPLQQTTMAEPIETNGMNGANGSHESEKPHDAPAQTVVRAAPAFSWLNAHPIFVVILVGPQEQPFGIQKDFLCHRSGFYKSWFVNNTTPQLEHVVKLPETTPEVFGLAQSYLYTGDIITDKSKVPSYDALVGLWLLGHKLEIDGLCDETIGAMIQCRRITQRIPSAPLLVQVWKDTPEGSTIRVLMLSWAHEFMRGSDARAEFANSLPKEILSELVVAMSSFDSAVLAKAEATASAGGVKANGEVARKNVHYLDEGDVVDSSGRKRSKRLSAGAESPSTLDARLPAARKAPRPMLPKPQKRRASGMPLDPSSFSHSQKLSFCADLLTRMLSGPGFWTRLVGPFRDPVDPSAQGVPDYLEKVKKPMDLTTIKAKMDRGEYADENEFVADVRQIFDNCFTYWKKGDEIWLAGEKLQKTFEEKYAGMNKWISKMDGVEPE